MPTLLMRESLRALYNAAHGSAPHIGLLLQRDWEGDANQQQSLPEREEEAKTKYIRKVCDVTVCDVTVDDLYRHAFRRWKGATTDQQRFRQLTLALKSRLFIGTAGGGALETACAIGHSHGMPYIPGSSVKGVVNAHARQRFAGKGNKGLAVCAELFGSSDLAGLISFHDAWWVPGSAESPLVPEVVTSHHMKYYSTDGETPATDWDRPVPNAQVAVQGRFLFVVEGPSAWLGLAAEILADALSTRGIGAKTRAGYGFFNATLEVMPTPTCEWVDRAIAELRKQTNALEGDTLRGRLLARKCAAIEDPDLKQAAIADIRRRLQEKGWWDDPPGKAARDAKNTYLQHLAHE